MKKPKKSELVADWFEEVADWLREKGPKKVRK
jgi:hypothetical protein